MILLILITVLSITGCGDTDEIVNEHIKEKIAVSGDLQYYTELGYEKRTEQCEEKHIEVSGVLTNIYTPNIYEIGDKKKDDLYIEVWFDEEPEGIKVGDYIVVDGVCVYSFDDEMVLHGCSITKHESIEEIKKKQENKNAGGKVEEEPKNKNTAEETKEKAENTDKDTDEKVVVIEDKKEEQKKYNPETGEWETINNTIQFEEHWIEGAPRNVKGRENYVNKLIEIVSTYNGSKVYAQYETDGSLYVEIHCKRDVSLAKKITEELVKIESEYKKMIMIDFIDQSKASDAKNIVFYRLDILEDGTYSATVD